jgi:hypothetical protein
MNWIASSGEYALLATTKIFDGGGDIRHVVGAGLEEQ